MNVQLGWGKYTTETISSDFYHGLCSELDDILSTCQCAMEDEDFEELEKDINNLQSRLRLLVK